MLNNPDLWIQRWTYSHYLFIFVYNQSKLQFHQKSKTNLVYHFIVENFTII